MIKITPEAKRIKDRREARRVLTALNRYEFMTEEAKNNKARAIVSRIWADYTAVGQTPDKSFAHSSDY